jgi:serine/threonine protein kinase
MIFERHDLHGTLPGKWYEPFDRYQPSPEFLKIASTELPSSWRLRRASLWFMAAPLNTSYAGQGWKIHVSTRSDQSEEVFRITFRKCVEYGVPFKFVADPGLLRLVNDKSWSREKSGKFFTIYPSDDLFPVLIQDLADALEGFEGPYILSDKRFRTSQTVYYRYGVHSGYPLLDPDGIVSRGLLDPTGKIVPDERYAEFTPPAWIQDPFPDEPAPEQESDSETLTLHNGRYEMLNSLKFSNQGGIYLALDRETDQQVVIKEARPHTAVDGAGRDSIARLHRSYEILKKLEHTGATPKPIEMFQEWEHHFLVQEYVPGPHLGVWAVTNSPLVYVAPSDEVVRTYLEKVKQVWSNLASLVASIHREGIAIGDLALPDILVTDETAGTLKLVDVDGAWEMGCEAPPRLYKLGFAPPSRDGEQRGPSAAADDVYALGTTILGTIYPLTALTEVDPSAVNRLISAYSEALGLGEGWEKLVHRMLGANPPSIDDVAVALEKWQPERPTFTPVPPIDLTSCENMVAGIRRGLLHSADTGASDRLFPSDPTAYMTNHLSIDFGAAGVLYALQATSGEIPAPFRAWFLYQIQNLAPRAENLAPGLYPGLAGIAWVLLELGETQLARQMLQESYEHPLLYERPELWGGSAGCGLAYLRMAQVEPDGPWLQYARAVGDWIVKTALRDQTGLYWKDEVGDLHIGFARGGTGIALFLLYLGLAVKEQRYIDTGVEALRYVCSLGTELPDGHLALPKGTVEKLTPTRVPFLFDGSTGLASVLLRYCQVLDDPQLHQWLESFGKDAERTFLIFPSLFYGLAGLGNHQLDMYTFTGDRRYLDLAQRSATRLQMFAVPLGEDGYGYPGYHMFRLSTDYTTGAAGVLLFFDRLQACLRGDNDRRGNFNFALDYLLR